MGTLEKIKAHGQELCLRLKAGEKLTADELATANMYLSLYGGKAGNAGKRITTETKQRNKAR